MAAELATPVDEYTGLPWLLVPSPYPYPRGRSDLADDNHAFHPANSPELASPAGEALKNSRVQRTDWWDHHMVYHNYFAGPPIPATEDLKFRAVVFAAAMYIPHTAIDCHGVKPTYVPVTPEMRQRLQRVEEVRVYRPGVVRGFLSAYLAAQDISHVPESRIDEFINTDDAGKKRFLGHWLLAQAAEKATESLSRQYKVAHKLGRIAPHLSTRAENFVQTTLGNSYERTPTIVRLQQKLAA